MALLLPILSFILIVAIDFCRLFYAYNVITNCARNGALWLSDPLCNGTVSPASRSIRAIRPRRLLTPTT